VPLLPTAASNLYPTPRMGLLTCYLPTGQPQLPAAYMSLGVTSVSSQPDSSALYSGDLAISAARTASASLRNRHNQSRS
jgi:hypothetical protein